MLQEELEVLVFESALCGVAVELSGYLVHGVIAHRVAPTFCGRHDFATPLVIGRRDAMY